MTDYAVPASLKLLFTAMQTELERVALQLRLFHTLGAVHGTVVAKITAGLRRKKKKPRFGRRGIIQTRFSGLSHAFPSVVIPFYLFHLFINYPFHPPIYLPSTIL